MSMMMLFFINIMAISTSSIFMIWMFLEMSTYIFISTGMLSKMKISKSEFMLIYLTVSFIASTLIIFSYSLMSEFFTSNIHFNYFSMKFSNILLMMAMLIKIGMIPFHSWVFSILNKMNWMNIMQMMTIMKIIPIWIMMMLSNMNFLLISIILSGILILFMPLKNNSTYNFLAISSIMNMMWILLTSMFSLLATMMYTSIYFFLTSSLIKIMMKMELKTFIYSQEKSTLVVLASLIGIPPLLGFLSKMNSIMLILNSENIFFMSNNFMMVFLMIPTAVVSYMYLKMIIPSLLDMKKTTMMKKNKNQKMQEILLPNFLFPATVMMIEIFM